MERIGILTAGRRPGHISGNLAHFQRLGKLGANMGLQLALFNLYPNGTFSTYRWSSRKGAFEPIEKKDVAPVLYNRIPSRNLENLRQVQARLQAWGNAGTVITNPHFLTKKELDHVWRQDENVRPFLPDTEWMRERSQLDQWLKERPQFYLKPISGKAGIGMMHVRSDRDGYHLREQRKGRLLDYGALSHREIAQALQQRQVFARYLLQEEVRLAHWGERRFDMRMLLHRMPGHGFQVSGMAVRSTPQEFVTTHVPNGGTRAPAKAVMTAVFGDEGERYQAQLVKVAERAANAIAQLPGDWCELSIDASFTPVGRPVLFEANAKPMKFDETEIELYGKKRLLESLSKFSRL